MECLGEPQDIIVKLGGMEFATHPNYRNTIRDKYIHRQQNLDALKKKKEKIR